MSLARSTLTAMIDGLLAAGLAARATRFVTTDDLGDLLIVEPARQTLPQRAADGLECPFCVGFWISGAVVGSYLLARRYGHLPLWRAAASWATLNYVHGHVNARLD